MHPGRTLLMIISIRSMGKSVEGTRSVPFFDQNNSFSLSLEALRLGSPESGTPTLSFRIDSPQRSPSHLRTKRTLTSEVTSGSNLFVIRAIEIVCPPQPISSCGGLEVVIYTSRPHRPCQRLPVPPPFPLLPSSMSSPASEPSSTRNPSGFHLAGSEKLRKPRWKLDSLPDLAGKVVMVTNPNNKIGKDTAKVLAPVLCQRSHR